MFRGQRRFWRRGKSWSFKLIFGRMTWLILSISWYCHWEKYLNRLLQGELTFQGYTGPTNSVSQNLRLETCLECNIDYRSSVVFYHIWLYDVDWQDIEVFIWFVVIKTNLMIIFWAKFWFLSLQPLLSLYSTGIGDNGKEGF